MRWWRSLSSMLFMTCRKAGLLISQKMDRSLATGENRALRVHLAICPACRRFKLQLELVRGVVKLVEIHPPDTAGVLSYDARTRIRAALEKGQKSS